MEKWPLETMEEDLTSLFLHTNIAIGEFLLNPTKSSYEKTWILYGAIAEQLGFTVKMF